MISETARALLTKLDDLSWEEATKRCSPEASFIKIRMVQDQVVHEFIEKLFKDFRACSSVG